MQLQLLQRNYMAHRYKKFSLIKCENVEVGQMSHYFSIILHFIYRRDIRERQLCKDTNSKILYVVLCAVAFGFCARRLSVERYSYSDVAGWVAGWLGVRHTPVLYQNG